MSLSGLKLRAFEILCTKVAADYDAGYRVDVLAERYGVSTNCILERARLGGAAMRQRKTTRTLKLSTADVEAIRSAPRGITQRELAERYAVDRKTISKTQRGLLYTAIRVCPLDAVEHPDAEGRQRDC